MPESATGSRHRVVALDVLRGFALCGILLVNIPWQITTIRMPWGPPSGGRYFAVDLIEYTVHGRFFPMFSFLFGVSFGLFLDTAATRARHPRLVLLRRLVVLGTLLACTGALMACEGGAGKAPGAAAVTATPSGAVASAAPVTPTVTSPTSTTAPSAPVGATDPVLSGKREVTISRVQASESGLSLDNGQLLEADDDSGRQLFVPTPLGGDKYLIKAYGTPNNHPASDEPTCWQDHDRNTAQSLTVEGVVCDANNPRQRFTITANGKGTYVISRDSAFLQYFPTSGLILEELGDAPLLSTSRFIDNGPARRPAGG